MSEPMLEVANLEVRYGGVRAVREVSFRVDRGEVVGLVGPNGAGKTTTLLALMGAVVPSAGDVRLGGRSLRGLAPEVIARKGMALVPEGRHIYGQFTVGENLRLGLVGRASRDGVDDDLEWIYSLFPGVHETLRRVAGHLSGGQQQQLAIARTLLARPEVLLLDEPTLGLSPAIVDALFGALDEVRNRGVTILLVEQRAQLAVGFADRTHVMREGRLTTQLTKADATDTHRLSAAYFG